MKKGMSRILSVLLVSALVISTGNVARADELNETEIQEVEGQGTEAEPENVIELMAEEEFVSEEESKFEAVSGIEGQMDEILDHSGMKSSLASGESLVNDIQLKTISTVSEAKVISKDSSKLPVSDISYSVGKPFAKKVKIKKGSLLIAACAYADSASASYVGVYKDAQLTKAVDGQVYVYTSVETKVFDIPKTGDYYIGVKSSITSSGSEERINYVTLSLCAFDGEERKIENNKEVLVGQAKGGTVNYFKFKAKYNGYIFTQTDKDASSVTVTLCNSKKKALSGKTAAGQNPTYGVKKGKTYYIKLINPYQNSDGFYLFKLNNKKITEKSGKTYKKAVSLKKKKTMKGTIEAGGGSKQADWYKFTLTGKKSVNIAVTGGTNDEIKFIVYEKAGKKLKKIGTRSGFNNFKGNIKSLGKWSKGTYYVKVQGKNAKASGYYTLKWK